MALLETEVVQNTALTEDMLGVPALLTDGIAALVAPAQAPGALRTTVYAHAMKHRLSHVDHLPNVPGGSV